MYAGWDYVFKSPRLVPEIEWVLVVFYPWRMLLIFFISGVACRFLLDKLGASAFWKDRLYRIVPVLVFGTIVINPIQNYFEVVSQGSFNGNYLEFWANYYMAGDQTLGKVFPTWDHLWFLAYLLVYVLVLSIFYTFTRGWIAKISSSNRTVEILVVAMFPWLAMSNILVSEIQPATFDLINDWAVHLRSAAVFLIGFIFAGSPYFWKWTQERRLCLAIVSISLLAVLLLQRFSAGSLPFQQSHEILRAAISGVYAWTSILVIVGYSAKYLDRTSQALTYLTAAVLPIYVLHQPIMIVIGFFLFPLNIALFYEVILILLGTTVFSLLFYDMLIKRFKALRFVFGVK